MNDFTASQEIKIFPTDKKMNFNLREETSSDSITQQILK